METVEFKDIMNELKKQWRMLWRDHFDDKVRAEGIANQNYPLLDVEKGRIIFATRDYKPVDFVEILQRYRPSDLNVDMVHPSPSAGGWGKFIRDVLSKQKRLIKKARPVPSEPERNEKQQRKKGGRGWLHYRT